MGSIALDTLMTPRGNRQNILGGSATYFSIAAGLLAPVKLVGVVGSDFPEDGWHDNVEEGGSKLDSLLGELENANEGECESCAI